jgi:hypothetical protein
LLVVVALVGVALVVALLAVGVRAVFLLLLAMP